MSVISFKFGHVACSRVDVNVVNQSNQVIESCTLGLDDNRHAIYAEIGPKSTRETEFYCFLPKTIREQELSLEYVCSGEPSPMRLTTTICPPFRLTRLVVNILSKFEANFEVLPPGASNAEDLSLSRAQSRILSSYERRQAGSAASAHPRSRFSHGYSRGGKHR